MFREKSFWIGVIVTSIASWIIGRICDYVAINVYQLDITPIQWIVIGVAIAAFISGYLTATLRNVKHYKPQIAASLGNNQVITADNNEIISTITPIDPKIIHKTSRDDTDAVMTLIRQLPIEVKALMYVVLSGCPAYGSADKWMGSPFISERVSIASFSYETIEDGLVKITAKQSFADLSDDLLPLVQPGEKAAKEHVQKSGKNRAPIHIPGNVPDWWWYKE